MCLLPNQYVIRNHKYCMVYLKKKQLINLVRCSWIYLWKAPSDIDIIEKIPVNIWQFFSTAVSKLISEIGKPLKQVNMCSNTGSRKCPILKTVWCELSKMRWTFFFPHLMFCSEIQYFVHNSHCAKCFCSVWVNYLLSLCKLFIH